MNKNIPKNIFIILLVILISVGGFGCMKENCDASGDEIKMDMFQYAKDKYDEDFEIVDFRYAVIRRLDSNCHDVLVLKNNDAVIFNVYSNINTNECFDDYGMSVADKKIKDFIKCSSSLDFTLMVDLLADEQILPTDIDSLSVSELVSEYEIVKIIAVVRVDVIEDNIDELYKLYQVVTSLNSNLIDYEVVSSNGTDEKLDKVFNNIRLEYENDWSQYSSISKYLSTTDNNLTKEQFELLIEEV